MDKYLTSWNFINNVWFLGRRPNYFSFFLFQITPCPVNEMTVTDYPMETTHGRFLLRSRIHRTSEGSEGVSFWYILTRK